MIKKWDQAGVKPEDIRSLQDFENIPILTKDEIRQDQIENPPFGSSVCVSPGQLARVQGTSGTAGKPTALSFSKTDMNASESIQNRPINGGKYEFN